MIDLGNGEVTSLTSKDAAALYPVWSPSGEQIVFIQGPDAGEDVWGGDEANFGSWTRTALTSGD
ncbi:MAG TPA: hypothetical protein VEV37_10180 [Bryobacteraceae bacterium]|nr:hypothetical protein [Bryobacteraceae bacterium]